LPIYISFLSQFLDVNRQVFNFNTISTTSGPSFIVPSSVVQSHLVNNMEKSQTLTLPIAKTETPLPLAEGKKINICLLFFIVYDRKN